MSSVSAVLLSFSLYNVRPWLCGGLLNDAQFLVSFIGLKSHNLLWTERWERFGMLIVILLLLLTFQLQTRGHVPAVECFGSEKFFSNWKKEEEGTRVLAFYDARH